MTGRDSTFLRVAAAALLVGALIGGLAGCTGGSSSAPEELRATAPVPNQVPDATVAVTDPPRPAATDVVLGFAEWDEATSSVQAAGYVSPVVEDGGTCTLELEGDGRTVTVDVPAEADATTTSCGGLRAPADRLAAGTWTVSLHYRSTTTEGASAPVRVEVPR